LHLFKEGVKNLIIIIQIDSIIQEDSVLSKTTRMGIIMKRRILQTEKDWLNTGHFKEEYALTNNKKIRCALVTCANPKQLITMVGGIPKEKDRQKNLPLINKLFGQMAILLKEKGYSSLLYNHPATGKSDGDQNKETIRSRSQTLASLTEAFCERIGVNHCSFIGSSSGAYIALRTLPFLKDSLHISKLVLLSPAAYPKEIEIIPYGKNFTRIVRQDWNITSSPAYEALRDFSNRGDGILIAFFENDDPPIPVKIQQHYKNVSLSLESKTFFIKNLTIHNTAHPFRRINLKKKQNIVDDKSVMETADRFVDFLS